MNEKLVANVILSLAKVLAEELSSQGQQTFLFEDDGRRYVLDFLSHPKASTEALHDWGPRIAGISAGGGSDTCPTCNGTGRV